MQRWPGRGSDGGARRDLEDLRAAINHHASENLHHAVISVWLPAKGEARDRWLTRKEAAALIWACWRYREVQTISRGPRKGEKVETGKRPLRHIARFSLLGVYSGTRAASIASASPERKDGRSFVDLERGVYFRRAQGKRKTNKRQPPVPVPARMLAHMRRWYRLGIIKTHFVEFNGLPVKSVKTGFKRAVKLAKLSIEDGNVTPHIIPAAGISFRVFVGKDRPLSCKNSLRHDVLRRDQFNLVLLAIEFAIEWHRTRPHPSSTLYSLAGSRRSSFSTFRDIDGEAASGRFPILVVHVSPCLPHRLDDLVERDLVSSVACES